MRIVTNNHLYPILHYWDLTKKELAEFDNWRHESLENSSFVRYKKQIYALSEFDKCYVEGWEFSCYHTAFSGILIKFVNSDYVKMASYFS